LSGLELLVGVDLRLRPPDVRESLGPQQLLADVDGRKADGWRLGEPERADLRRRVGGAPPAGTVEGARRGARDHPHELAASHPFSSCRSLNPSLRSSSLATTCGALQIAPP